MNHCKSTSKSFIDLIIHATGADPTSVTWQVVIILFIRHLFNKEIKKQVVGTKNIQTLRHAMTLAQEAEIKLKKYKGSNDDDPSVMHVSVVPHSEVLAVQRQSSPHGNNQDSNQIQHMNAPRLNWKQILYVISVEEKGIQLKLIILDQLYFQL